MRILGSSVGQWWCLLVSWKWYWFMDSDKPYCCEMCAYYDAFIDSYIKNCCPEEAIDLKWRKLNVHA